MDNQSNVNRTSGLPASAPGAAAEPKAVTWPKPIRLLRLPVVCDRTARSRSGIYADVKAGTFPAPVRISARCVGWREEDIDAWIQSKYKVGA